MAMGGGCVVIVGATLLVVTESTSESVPPSPSATSTLTCQVPLSGNAWLMLAPVCAGLPSSKFQVNSKDAASVGLGSLAIALKLSVCPSSPLVGPLMVCSCGGRLAMMAVSMAVALPLS